ncbi:hypothetical protein DNTS_014476 [Danionella cerebrum]|uniref:Uncharacterized protein n=1 Tax=Danionella cerebrum TaxID=2873325 RepID=A0A553PVC4_9TELE|nr:hypothetical protein DNTS_014476 [Danionella translucida]
MNFQVLIITLSVAGALLIIGFLICIFCCCKCENCGLIQTWKANCRTDDVQPGRVTLQVRRHRMFLIEAAPVEDLSQRLLLISSCFENKMNRRADKMATKQEERKAAMKIRHDEIRQKYGLSRASPYARFENPN